MDHAKVILSGILPGRRDRLLHTLTVLEPEHFRNAEARNLFNMLVRYWDLGAGILPRSTLSDLLNRSNSADASKVLLYEQLYDECAANTVEDHEFRYAIEAIKDLRSKQMTGEAITASMEILERGLEIDREEFQGHRDARDYLYGELAKIDRLGNRESAPEGDMRDDADEVMAEYASRKEGTDTGIMTGIPQIDNNTNGLQPSELVLVCAYTGQGKTQGVTQISWDACVQQGLNVFFATTETTRAQVRRRVISRHSRLPQFGIPEGLNSFDIKNGTLSPAMEQKFNEVVTDLSTNPNYGRLYISQIPRGGSLGAVEARLNRQNSMWNVDLVVIDYLALLQPRRSRQSEREELNDVLKSAKVLAATFDGGRGVPVVSPWQMSRAAYTDALRTGEYSLASLADTAEAERSADLLISLLRHPDARHEARGQILKNRDGDTPPSFLMEIDYRTSYFGPKQSVAVEDLFSSGLMAS